MDAPDVALVGAPVALAEHLPSDLRDAVVALVIEARAAFEHEAVALSGKELLERSELTNGILRTGWGVLCARIRELEAVCDASAH